MKIAIPLVNCKLANHFGYCISFAFFDVDLNDHVILRRRDIPAPPCQPGLLPMWLAERGVNLVIAGGIGQRALTILAQQKIGVILGAPKNMPEKLVAAHLGGSMQIGKNPCDH